ncbi:CTP-dependent riboflavin kinase [Haloplanus halobius]|uniref:CTP-dependent riboflavin kinase n=1 Tax=Haloplanus halobius TaxID=2934938 RepID=UPI00200F818B|nr:CTP-dependent riboflavin kinase [Haloplanus sp. XH21]
MAETVAASTVGHDELAALKRIALDGGLTGRPKLSCSGLAERLDTSAQTASRRLQRLEDGGLLDREVLADGQRVSVTQAGEAALRREYASYRRLFEDGDTLSLDGTVTSGMGEGKHYISLSGYMSQFRERLGYEPYPGTLNVELTAESVRERGALETADIDATPIDGWEDDDRTFGSATCYAARVEAGSESYDGAHIIVPDRTHHDATQLELIAPVKLRGELGLSDGDTLTVHLEAR